MKSGPLMMPIQNNISDKDWSVCAKPEFYHERVSVLNFYFFPISRKPYMLQKAEVSSSPQGSYDQNPYT